MGEQESLSTSSLEVKTERDEALDLFEGKQEWKPCVRVLYRRKPTRKWTRVLVSADDGLTLEDIEESAFDIAVLHERQAKGDTT